MRFQVSTSKLTGIPGASGWAQVHEFTPSEPEKLKLRGHLFAVISTHRQEEGVEAISAGRELIARLQEEYFGKEEGSVFNALKAAIEKILEEFRTTSGEIEIAAGVITDDAVYTGVGGCGKVAILRDGMLASILEGKKGSVICASGYPKEKDTLIIGTTSFFENISSGVIRAGLATESPGAATEYFAPIIRSKEDSGRIGIAVINFQKVGQELVEERTHEVILPPKVSRFSFLSSFKIQEVFKYIIQRLPERKVFVRTSETSDVEIQGGRKTTLSIGAILLILLVISIGFGVKAKRDKDAKSLYSAKLTEAQHQLSEAEGLFSLNPDRARELLSDSRDKTDELLAQKISDPELTALKAKIEEDEGKILGEYKVEPQEFIDLSLLSQGFSADKLFASGDNAYILDKQGKRVVSVAFGNKRSEVVAGPSDLDNASDATAYEDRVFAESDSGIYEVTANKKKVINKDWTGDVWIYAYTGNIYLFDKGTNMIWRYQGTGDSFAAKQKWLGPGVSPDFSQVVSWAIDGSVWVIRGDGRVLKFTLGKQDAFATSGVAPDLDSAAAIYTNEKLKYVYILEPKKNRVLVLSKDGNFAAQYLKDKIGSASGLVVSETDKKMILLMANKLYSIELKHL